MDVVRTDGVETMIVEEEGRVVEDVIVDDDVGGDVGHVLRSQYSQVV